ncbi:phage baseplate assembly protein V [Methylocystis sp. WRRC1]|uniref:phage baseplate assembly protein V n=1 Tax=Methylocystis sp. WRRC1 TaxID=1732014 RepID=UPI001D15A1B5|nr:phage baseplate assembly protein V [Methylocystis sp. WRRC1]
MNIENLIFRCLERFLATKSAERYGIVTSYDPKKHAAKVKIQPSGQETGWIPIHAHHIGDGWGILVGLSPGDQVRLGYSGGDFEVAEIISRVHSDEDKPPQVESGEILLKHTEAGSFKFDKDKNMVWTGANGQVVTTDKKGNMSLSLKVQNNQDADKDSPTFSVSLDGGDNAKHSVIIHPKNGITHKSSVKVTIDAEKIEHKGSLKVSGSILATKVIQSGDGFKGPLFSGTAGDPGDADNWG